MIVSEKHTDTHAHRHNDKYITTYIYFKRKRERDDGEKINEMFAENIICTPFRREQEKQTERSNQKNQASLVVQHIHAHTYGIT